MEDVDCASILIDIDLPILEISSESMFINIISVKPGALLLVYELSTSRVIYINISKVKIYEIMRVIGFKFDFFKF